MAILTDTTVLRALEQYLHQLAENRVDAAKDLNQKIVDLGSGEDTLTERITLNRRGYGYLCAARAYQHASDELREALDLTEAMATDKAEEVPE